MGWVYIKKVWKEWEQLNYRFITMFIALSEYVRTNKYISKKTNLNTFAIRKLQYLKFRVENCQHFHKTGKQVALH